MSELQFDYGIRSELPARPETPAMLGAKFLNAIDALSRIDPTIFTNWQVMDFPVVAPLPLAEARPRIAEIIENNAGRDDFRQPVPEEGYTASAFTTDAIKARRVSLLIQTGGKEKGKTWLQTGEWPVFPDQAVVNYSLFKSMLLAIDAVWPPPWACAYAFRVNYFQAPLYAGAQPFPYSRFHMPWIAYLSNSLIARLSLPSGIVMERTPDGGLLMSATEDRLDPTNPEHLRRARILAEILMKSTGYSSSEPVGRAR